MFKGLTRLTTQLVASVAIVAAGLVVFAQPAAAEGEGCEGKSKAEKNASQTFKPYASRSAAARSQASTMQNVQSRAMPAGDSRLAAKTTGTGAVQSRQAAQADAAPTAARNLEAAPSDMARRQAPTEDARIAAKQFQVAAAQASRASGDPAQSAARSLRAGPAEASQANRRAPTGSESTKAE